VVGLGLGIIMSTTMALEHGVRLSKTSPASLLANSQAILGFLVPWPT